MKYLLFVCFSIMFSFVNGQANHTGSEYFDSLQLFLKQNYAGYDDKVNSKTRKHFEEHTAKHAQILRKVRKQSHSYQVIKSWLRFFKDEHLSVSVRLDTANGKLASDLAEAEKLPLETIRVDQLANTTSASVEGIYYTRDSSYKVAVVKNDDGFRKYAGVVLYAKAPEWKPGMIKFELVPAGSVNKFDVIWYNRYHQTLLGDLDFNKENTFYKEGWYKSNFRNQAKTYRSGVPLFEEEKQHNAFFKLLDDKTSYLRIQSFDAGFIPEIDSVITANRVQLETLPYMIIDLRGNGGGADPSYRPLKRFMYTDPVKSIGVDLLATSYNIDATIQLINSISGMAESDKNEYRELMEKARASNQRMFDFFPDTTETSTPIPYPKKIGILIDEFCGSTTEQFLFAAKQSRKVTLFGKRTIGVLDYANVRDKEFYYGFTLHYPTTRSRRIDAGLGIDNIGILPDVPLDFEQEGWLKRVQQMLSK